MSINDCGVDVLLLNNMINKGFVYCLNILYNNKLIIMISNIPIIRPLCNNEFVSGIKNVGNTCYINASSQILLFTHELNDIITNTKEETYKNIPETIVVIEWKEMKNILTHMKCIVSPFKYISRIQEVVNTKESMNIINGGQNDMCEFLLFIIDCMHTSLSLSCNLDYNEYLSYMNIQHSSISEKCYKLLETYFDNNYSEIMNLFYGVHLNIIQSNNSINILSIQPELFSSIQLDIPENIEEPTIHDCMDLYCNPVLLEDENAYYNDKTKAYESALKNTSFWKLPHILILTLNRFKTNVSKNKKNVIFPIRRLDLSKYAFLQNYNDNQYELYGLGCHNGNILNGHYYCYVKNGMKWYFCNDEQVAEITNLQQLSNPDVYCLFYRKTFSSI
jgi:ubiquitin carboxyl-terminal hydrolase 8